MKEYVSALFPEAAPLASVDADHDFPAVDATLLPISDSLADADTRALDANRTPPARRHEYTVAVSRPPAAEAGPSTLAPGTLPPGCARAGSRPASARAELPASPDQHLESSDVSSRITAPSPWPPSLRRP